MQQADNLFVRVNQISDGCIVIHGINHICRVFGQIYINDPRSVQNRLRTIIQVRDENFVKQPFFIRFVEFIQSIAE